MKPQIPKPLTAEHKELHAELVKLTRARGRVGEAERKPEAARFAEALKLHVLSEEQVLYPAAILVGEYVRARLEP